MRGLTAAAPEMGGQPAPRSDTAGRRPGTHPRSLLGQDVESPGSRSRDHPAQQRNAPPWLLGTLLPPKIGQHTQGHEGRQEAETHPRSQGQGQEAVHLAGQG